MSYRLIQKEVGKWKSGPKLFSADFVFVSIDLDCYTLIFNILKTTFINNEPSLPIYSCYNIKNFIYVRENIDYVFLCAAAVPIRSQNGGPHIDSLWTLQAG